MSWYFFGGFSAYCTLPSGRCLNHCGCSLHVGVIGRALKGDVERNLDAEARAPVQAAGGSPPSVPSCGRISLWPPSAAPIAQGLPTSSGLGLERIVGALAVDAADRMDGRKVQHVESHLGQVRQPRLDVAKFAVTPGLRRGRTRKQFIPAAEAGALAIDQEIRRGAGGASCDPRSRATICARAGSSASAAGRRSRPRLA